MRLELRKALESGVYPAKVVEVTDNVGPYGPQVRLKFAVSGPHGNVMVYGWTSTAYSWKSKLGRWTTALFGGDLPDFIETDELVGKECRVVLEQREDYLAVRDVLPAKGVVDRLYDDED